MHPREAGPDRLLRFEDPIELVLPVFVLARPECVRDTLQRIHKGAGAVIGGVHLQSNRRVTGVTGG